MNLAGPVCRWDHLLILLLQNQQEDYPERTGIRVRTERYCDRSGRRSASRNPAPPAPSPLRGFGGGGGTRRRQPNGGFREIVRYPTGAAVGIIATRRPCPGAAVESDRRRRWQGGRQACDRGPRRGGPIARLLTDLAPRRG